MKYWTLLLIAGLLYATTLRGETNTNNTMNISTSSAGFSWVKKGKLAMVAVSQGKDLSVLHIYSSSAGDKKTVTGSLSAMGEIVRQEVGDTISEVFIKEELPSYLVAVASQNAVRILDASYLSDYEASLTSEDVREAFRGDKISLARLKNLGSQILCEIASDQWRVEVAVLARSGSAERWIFSGARSPFSVERVERRLLAADGSIKPLPEFGQ